MPNPKANHSDDIFQIDKIDHVGSFIGRCAEMCGTYHSMMNFEVRAVTEAQFADYIKYRTANPTATNGQALAAIGSPALAEKTAPFNTSRSSKQASGLDVK